MVANLTRGQLNRETDYSLSPFEPENFAFHETGSTVPSCVSLLISPHSD